MTHGFIMRTATFSAIDFPEARLTAASGLNNVRDIVGYYEDASGATHGFLFGQDEIFSTIDVPGAIETRAEDINARDDIVGSFRDNEGVHGYLLRNGRFATLDFPGAVSTVATGINDNGLIVGYFQSGGDRNHGFLLEEQVVEPGP